MKNKVVLVQTESARLQTVFFPTRFAQAVADIVRTAAEPHTSLQIFKGQAQAAGLRRQIAEDESRERKE